MAGRSGFKKPKREGHALVKYQGGLETEVPTGGASKAGGKGKEAIITKKPPEVLEREEKAEMETKENVEKWSSAIDVKKQDTERGNKEGIISGISTNIGVGGGLLGGAKAQAERLLSEPGEEAGRAIKGTIGGAIVGVGGTAALTALKAHPVLSSVGAVYLGDKIAQGNLNAVWAAVDNIATGTAFSSRKVLDSYKSGTIDISEAMSNMRDIKEEINFAEGFVKKSVLLNPYLWFGSGKAYLVAIKKSQEDWDRDMQMIMSVNQAQEIINEQFWNDYRSKQMKGGA